MFDNYVMKVNISNSHVDNNLKMKEIAIVNSLQDIEGLHIENLNEFSNYLFENNIGVFLLYRQIDIIKKPEFGEELTLSTHPYNTNIVSGYRHIYIYNELDELLVQTNSFGVFVNLDSYQPTRIPRNIVKTINDGTQSDTMELLPRKIDYDENKEMELLNYFYVKRSNIDRYNHVNNAFYIEFALDSFKEEISYNRIRAEYKKSYQLGDLIKIYLNVDEKDKKIVILMDQDDNINAIIEFLDVKLDN